MERSFFLSIFAATARGELFCIPVGETQRPCFFLFFFFAASRRRGPAREICGGSLPTKLANEDGILGSCEVCGAISPLVSSFFFSPRVPCPVQLSWLADGLWRDLRHGDIQATRTCFPCVDSRQQPSHVGEAIQSWAVPCRCWSAESLLLVRARWLAVGG